MISTLALLEKLSKLLVCLWFRIPLHSTHTGTLLDCQYLEICLKCIVGKLLVLKQTLSKLLHLILFPNIQYYVSEQIART